MYTKEWYRQAWGREKKRASWYESAYKYQNARRKELEREINRLKAKLVEIDQIKSVGLHGIRKEAR